MELFRYLYTFIKEYIFAMKGRLMFCLILCSCTVQALNIQPFNVGNGTFAYNGIHIWVENCSGDRYADEYFDVPVMTKSVVYVTNFTENVCYDCWYNVSYELKNSSWVRMASNVSSYIGRGSIFSSSIVDLPVYDSDGVYIFNNIRNFTLNETRLNATINQRVIPYFITEYGYTASNKTLNGGNFNITGTFVSQGDVNATYRVCAGSYCLVNPGSAGTPYWITLSGNTTANLSVNGGNVHIGGRISQNTSEARGVISVSLGTSNNATGTSSATVGGENSVSSGSGSFIGGGSSNRATNNYAAIIGGTDNLASGQTSTIMGGFQNTATQYASSVVGGEKNTVSAQHSAIVGGVYNQVTGQYSIVLGGYANKGQGFASSIGGGYFNTATNSYSVVAGGNTNIASSDYAFVGGGLSNHADGYSGGVVAGGENYVSGGYSGILAGVGNKAFGGWNSVSSGFWNTASGYYSAIGSGRYNAINVAGYGGFIGAGQWNIIDNINAVVVGGQGNNALGEHSAVLGGGSNWAVGLGSTATGYGNAAESEYSFVGGRLTKAYGSAAVAFGYQSIASGSWSFSQGYKNNVSATGKYSLVLGGSKNIANAENETIIGVGLNKAMRNSMIIGFDISQAVINTTGFYGNMSYGEMWNKSDTGFAFPDLTAVDTYVQIKNLTSGTNNMVTLANSNLTVSTSGTYKVSADVSLSAGGASEFGIKVFVNEVGQNNCYSHSHVATNVDVPFGLDCLLRLSANDIVSIRVDDHTNPPNDPTIKSANVNIVRIGW